MLIRDEKVKWLDFGSTRDPVGLQPHPGYVWLKSGCRESIPWRKVRLTKQRNWTSQLTAYGPIGNKSYDPPKMHKVGTNGYTPRDISERCSRINSGDSVLIVLVSCQEEWFQ